VLRARYVREREDRGNGVERLRLDLECRVVCLDERRTRHAFARAFDLCRGDVDADIVVARSEHERARGSRAATELEHVGAIRQTRVEIAEELFSGIAGHGHRRVCLGDRVVAAANDLSRVGQRRSTTPAIAIPNPMHMQATP
jgi:hypothetical protein